MIRMICAMIAASFVWLIPSIQAHAEEKCAEGVLALMEVPEGTITYEYEKDHPLFLTVTVTNSMPDGNESVATTQIPLRIYPTQPDAAGQILLFFGNTQMEIRLPDYHNDLSFLETLLPYMNLDSPHLWMLNEDGDIGFWVNVKWSYSIRRNFMPKLGSTDIWPSNFSFSGRELQADLRRLRDQAGSLHDPADNNTASPTSDRFGYMWWISPLIALKLDEKATLRRVAPCITDLAIRRIDNPPARSAR